MKFLKFLLMLFTIVTVTALVPASAEAGHKDWNGNKKVVAAAQVATVTTPQTVTSGSFFTCPAALRNYSWTCTYVNATVTVYDHTTGTNRTWHLGTSVGIGYWTQDPGTLCGSHGVPYVWVVYWLEGNQVGRAVIGDTWLQTGTSADWGPQRLNSIGGHENPDGYAGPQGQTGYCNSSVWNWLADFYP